MFFFLLLLFTWKKKKKDSVGQKAAEDWISI